MLAVFTGPVRSGKSSAALALALESGRRVVIAVGGRADDEEMERRIAGHQAGRPAGIEVIETPDNPEWLARVPADACLLVDCLGTILGAELEAAGAFEADLVSADSEAAAMAKAEELSRLLLAREAPTVVVTNEVGWGVVPAHPSGRLFRDVVGRANRTLIDRADAAWLVVGGRLIDLTSLSKEAQWPR